MDNLREQPKLELGFMRHKNKEISQEIVDFAMSHNQNYFETCYFYFNDCEQYIYNLLSKYNRNDYKICGKMPVKFIMERSSPEKIFTEQIERAPNHYFDMYLLQALDIDCIYSIVESKAIEFLLNEKKKGNIGKLGLSIQCLPEVYKKFLDLKCWDFVQLPMNYFDWFVCRGDELYELTKQYNLPWIAQAPLKGGTLLKVKPFDNYSSSKAAIDFVSKLKPSLILTGCSHLKSYEDTYIDLITTDSNDINFDIYKNAIFNYLKSTKISCYYCGRCRQACEHNIKFNNYFYLYNDLITNYNKEKFSYFAMATKEDAQVFKFCVPACNNCIINCPLENNPKKIWIDKLFQIRV